MFSAIEFSSLFFSLVLSRLNNKHLRPPPPKHPVVKLSYIDGEGRAWVWRYWLWVGGLSSPVPTSVAQVSQLFFVAGTCGLMFFSKRQQSNVKILYGKQSFNSQYCMGNSQTLDRKSTFISGVKCILVQYAFKPSIHLSCDIYISFHDSQQSYLKWQ